MAAMSISTHSTKFWRYAAFSAFFMNPDFAARKTSTPCEKSFHTITKGYLFHYVTAYTGWVILLAKLPFHLRNWNRLLD
jgi:hypothetical protein